MTFLNPLTELFWLQQICCKFAANLLQTNLFTGKKFTTTTTTTTTRTTDNRQILIRKAHLSLRVK